MRKSWGLLIVLSLSLSLAVPILYGGWDSLVGIANLPGWLFLILVGMVVCGWVFNASRVRLLAGALGVDMQRRTAYGTVIASEFAGAATPAGAGNQATYVFLLTQHGLGVGPAAAVVAVNQLVDLVFFATAVPLALLFYAVDSGATHPLRLAAQVGVSFALGLGALVWLVRHYRPVVLWLGRVLRHVPRLREFRYRLARLLIQFRRNIRLLFGMGRRRLVTLYLLCVGHWLLRYGILPVVLWALSHPVPWGYLFAMQGLILSAGQATFLPGGGGGVEVGFSAFLRPYLDPATTATALLVWRFATFYWYLLLGAPVFVLMAGTRAKRLLGLART